MSQDDSNYLPTTPTHNEKFLASDSSVFRERSRAPMVAHQQQQALAEKFLRAIEEEREREEEDEYRKQLRNLWSRYQVEEGDMEKELFDNDLDYPVNNDDRKKKRQVRESSSTAIKMFIFLVFRAERRQRRGRSNLLEQQAVDAPAALVASVAQEALPRRKAVSKSQ